MAVQMRPLNLFDLGPSSLVSSRGPRLDVLGSLLIRLSNDQGLYHGNAAPVGLQWTSVFDLDVPRVHLAKGASVGISQRVMSRGDGSHPRVCF